MFTVCIILSNTGLLLHTGLYFTFTFG